MNCSGERTSLCIMDRSREPEESIVVDQANVPTRERWPVIVRINLHLCASQICTSPVFVPTAKNVPRCVHATEQMESDGAKSHSFVTLDVNADQRYTHDPKPTAKTLCDDQSTKFK